MIKKFITILSIGILSFTSIGFESYADGKYNRNLIKGNTREISMELNKSIFEKANEVFLINTSGACDCNEDKTYVHSQKIASDTWNIKHDLNKFPSVSVVDSANTLVLCDIDYLNENELVVRSKAPFSGTCYCN